MSEEGSTFNVQVVVGAGSIGCIEARANGERREQSGGMESMSEERQDKAEDRYHVLQYRLLRSVR